LSKSKRSEQPIILAVVGDLHCGSSLGLCPAQGIDLDDGGHYSPSKTQTWVWGLWVEYWERVREAKKRLGARLVCVLNGEPIDGVHHGTVQLVSAHLGTQMEIARQCLSEAQRLSPEAWHVTRGTEAHSGKSAPADEAIARWLEAEKDPETGASSSYHVLLDLNGVGVDITHHGRAGLRPWTRATGVNALAAELVYEYARADWKPQLAIRNHNHTAADSFDNHAIRVVSNGCWQLASAFGKRIVPDTAPSLGGLWIECESPGNYRLEKLRVDLPSKLRPQPWRLKAA
jgi:hypothetical protein